MRLRVILITCRIVLNLINCSYGSKNVQNNIMADQVNDTLGMDYNDDIMIKRLVEEIEQEYTDNEAVKRFKGTWSDLDTRPLPEWCDKAKIGIFLHWGVYSVPGFRSEWFWYHWCLSKTDAYIQFMDKNYPPNFTYQEFASSFKAEFFEPHKLARLFAKAGAKYVIITSKHHDGFALFPSRRSFSWNSVDIGPHRDLVGDLAKAVRQAGLKFGVYHSLYEWFNPMYLADKKKNFTTNIYVTNKLRPDIEQLVNDYKPSVLWSDGDWEAPDTYWNSTGLLAWLYNYSPVKNEVVVNDRWGWRTRCKHGDFYNCEDRYNPGKLQHHKWENAFTLDRASWGYNRGMNLADVLTVRELLREVVATVSCGGNALINIGPTKEGTIAPIFEERLLQLGEWLAINGAAIYGSFPWLHQNDSKNREVWYTCTKIHYWSRHQIATPAKTYVVVAVYATFLDWPEKNILILRDITTLVERQWDIELLGNEGKFLKWKLLPNNRTAILLPGLETTKSKFAWTLKFKPNN